MSTDTARIVAHFEVIPSPAGALTVVEGPRGLLRVDFGRTPRGHLQEHVRRALGPFAVVRRAAGLAASRELAEYFAGRRRRFTVPVDLRAVAPFERRVLGALRRVGFGALVTYGDLAARVGSPPGAARAVGGAMRKNPVPIVVPCHRVVASDGTLGGFSGGLSVKRRLHILEGIGALGGGWSASGARRHLRGRPAPRRAHRATI